MDVNTTQAAQLLGVTTHAITKYIRTGKLNAQRRGLKSFMINLNDLRSFCETHKAFFDNDLAEQLEQAARN